MTGRRYVGWLPGIWAGAVVGLMVLAVLLVWNVKAEMETRDEERGREYRAVTYQLKRLREELGLRAERR